MSERVWNFAAGPAALPLPVLERARDELVSLPGAGASILEISHRSKAFADIADETEANLRELLEIPESHRVLFLQGGASMQFAMIPMNLLAGRSAEYVVTGSWGRRAAAEAARLGDVRVAWDGGNERYTSVPDLAGVALDRAGAYVHVTSNETIEGVEFAQAFEKRAPSAPPLVCDASSDFLSRPIDVSRFGAVYAGAQKNAGPAGLTIVLLHDDLLAPIPDGIAAILDYRTHVEHRSLYNTPPTFAIYVLLLVTRWLRDEIGGLDKMAERNEEKAGLLYDAIDGSAGFYRGHAAPPARSRMNVTWRLPDEALEATFVQEAAASGLVELRGHRSVRGIRASIYNAMPLEGVRALRSFMDDFAARHA